MLCQIWELSDPNGKGFLDKDGFFTALKLIALAQCGKDVAMVNIQAQAPAPNMVIISNTDVYRSKNSYSRWYDILDINLLKNHSKGHIYLLVSS